MLSENQRQKITSFTQKTLILTPNTHNETMYAFQKETTRTKSERMRAREEEGEGVEANVKRYNCARWLQPKVVFSQN